MSELRIGESSVIYYPILYKDYIILEENSGLDRNQTISTEFFPFLQGVKLTYIGTEEKSGKNYNLFVFSKPPEDLKDVSFKGWTGYKNCCDELQKAAQIFEGGEIKGKGRKAIPVEYVKHLTSNDIWKILSIVEDLKNGKVYQLGREETNLALDNYVYGKTVNIKDLLVDDNEDIIRKVQENFGTYNLLLDGYTIFLPEIKAPNKLKNLFFPIRRKYLVAKNGLSLKLGQEAIAFGCYTTKGGRFGRFSFEELYETYGGESEVQGCICPIFAVDAIYEENMEIYER